MVPRAILSERSEMNAKRKFGVFAALAAMGVSAFAATTYHVEVLGSDETGDGTSEAPFYSLKPALERAEDGDTILIGEGDFTNMAIMLDLPDDTGQATVATGSSFFGVVKKGVTIRGAGEGKTLIKCRYSQFISGDHANSYSPAGLWIEHGDAVVEGIAIYDALKTPGWSRHIMRGGALHVLAGTVRNSRVFNCRVTGEIASRPTVYLNGGDTLFENCIVTNCGGDTWCQCSMVHCIGATMDGCTFANASAAGQLTDAYGAACAVDMTGGVCRNCVFRDNVGSGAQGRATALNVKGSNELIERCLFKGNKTGAHWCGAAFSSGGGSTFTMRNCVFDGNENTTTDSDSAGAVYFGKSGAFQHCTFINNRASAGAGALRMSNGIFVGCIFAGNVGPAGNDVVKAGGTISWSSYPGASGNNNIDATLNVDPLTYIPYSEEVIDAMRNGENLVSDDFYGNPRPAYPAADEEGSDYPDMGAVEVNKEDEGDLTVTFVPPDSRVPQGCVVTLRSEFAAKDMTLASCVYTLVSGDTEIVLDGEGLEQEIPSDLACAVYDVNVRIENSRGLVGVSSNKNVFAVMPTSCYVAVDGSETYPYATPATAARTLETALGTVYGTAESPAVIRVCDGNYPAVKGMAWTAPSGNPPRPITYLAVADYPVRIIGNNAHPENVVFNLKTPSGTNERSGGAMLDNAAAEVSGMTFTGSTVGQCLDWGAILNVVKGTVSNCVCRSYTVTTSTGTIVSFKGGRGENIVVSDITVGDIVYGSYSDGVSVSGDAVVRNLLIEGLRVLRYNNSEVVGLLVNGGDVRDVVVRNVTAGKSANNDEPNNAVRAGVRMTGGRLENCRISACTNLVPQRACTSGFAGFSISGGEARNVLVENCRTLDDKSASSVGLCVDGGTVINATVVGNSAVNGATAGFYQTAGAVTNTLVWANVSEGETPIYLTQTGGALSHCCVNGLPAAKDADGNFAADPVFKKDTWTLSGASPCVNAGVNAEWMAEATDLAGDPRILNKTVDIGCYENPKRGLMILFK